MILPYLNLDRKIRTVSPHVLDSAMALIPFASPDHRTFFSLKIEFLCEWDVPFMKIYHVVYLAWRMCAIEFGLERRSLDEAKIALIAFALIYDKPTATEYALHIANEVITGSILGTWHNSQTLDQLKEEYRLEMGSPDPVYVLY